MGDYTGGYTGAVSTLQDMRSKQVLDAFHQQQIEGMRRAAEASARQQQARQQLGGVLGGLFPGGAQPPPQVPPPPGTVAGGPMPPGVGVASAPPPMPPQAMPGQMPPPPTMQAGAPPPVAQAGGQPPAPAAGPAGAPQPAGPAAGGAPPPIPIPPFRPLPSAPPGAPNAGPGGIPPPPGAPPVAAGSGVHEPKPISLQAVVEGFKKAGIPQERWMDMLEELTPVMNAQNRQELQFLQANNSALKAANDMYMRTLTLGLKRDEVGIKRDAEDRRQSQGDRKLDQAQDRLGLLSRKLSGAAGGVGKIEQKEYIYPKNAEGKVDQTLAPIGIRGTTKSGKIIYLDADGLPTTAAALGAGGTAKEGKDASGSGRDNVRTSIVRSGVVNALNRLDEIEKQHPSGSTSSFFGTHGDNPATRALYGAGQSLQSGKQQDIDAKWAAFIDEAIPVFTGGLRGSDAFRRFLIEQAPGPGAKPAVIKEKMRLFRENINGTSKAFFSKFRGDPSMWAAGTKEEDVKASAPSAAPAGAPKPGTVQDGFRFKGGDPSKSENWEKAA